jgi:sugar phosphate isomerase/epimerase
LHRRRFVKNKVIMHINYCEQGQTISELCRKAADWGFDGIEFRGRRTGVAETPEEYLDQITRSTQEAGLTDVLFGSPTPNMMLPDAAARAKEIEEGIRFYRMAKDRLKARLTVSNAFTGGLRNPDKNIPYGAYERQGSGCATEDQWKWATEGYRIIGDAVAKLGVRLAFETHMGYLHDTPLAAKKLVDMIGKPFIGINLDYGNAVYFQTNPSLAETIKALGASTFYTHLKNSIAIPSGGRVPTGLADGQINHREYLRLLKESGFTGPIGIEAPRPGDREWYAVQDLTYIRSVMKDLG